MHSYTQLQLQASIHDYKETDRHNKMKRLILILAVSALAAASPVPVDKIDGDDNEPAHQEVMQLDLEEMDLEFFPNGTVKSSSIDDLVRLYYKKKDVDDFSGNKTEEHFEEEDQDGGDEEGRSKRRIFGTDNRSPISNYKLRTLLPYCALAQVSNGCTAMFIGPNHALTAGRCVYDRTRREFRTGLRLYRSRNCRNYGTSMTATYLFTVNGYANAGLQEYDYGLIYTSERSPCWTSFGFADPWRNKGLDLLGYPFNRVAGCSYRPAYISSYSYSSTTRNDLFLQHRCDTSAIGAPLMSDLRDNGVKSVTGVNVYNSPSYNHGPRINRDRFYTIVEWMRRTGYDPLLS